MKGLFRELVTGESGPPASGDGRRDRAWGRAAVLAFALLAAVPARVPAGEAAGKEVTVESVIPNYLMAFATHVRWPEETLPAGAPIKVGLLGRVTFGPALERALAGRTVNGHPLVVVRAAEMEKIEGCQIVFVERPNAARLRDLQRAGTPPGVLTVVYSPETVGAESLIELVILPDKSLRYTLDIARFKAAGLTPSAGLLKMAVPRPKP